ncbi:glutathione S-transferase-like [Chironomus tepperi]|uniref:glutathione S-transferase-like n=1 Tax=Chironomus tepperi TaxID=113505 RepID=UPI00391EF4CF
MATYKLTYFNFPALGEPIRFLLNFGGVQFEDNRIEWSNWYQIKSTTPLGQVPILEVDGEVLYQTIPICRFLGAKFNLLGDNEMENYKIDNVVQTITDLRMKIEMVNFDKFSPPNVVEEKRAQLKSETILFYLKNLELIASKNDGFLATKKLTWGDFYFASMIDYMNWMMKENLIENFVNLKRIYKNVMENDKIKTYIEKRPKPQMG